MVDPATAKEIADFATVILRDSGLLEKISDLFLRPKQHTIILLGASGTGKTAFCRRLRGLAAFVPREMRTRVSEAHTGRLKGGFKLKILETPGQPIEPFCIHRRETISRATKEANLGIINVVSYGYHEGSVKPNVAVTKSNTVRSSFLDNRRQEEITLLDEWKDGLCAPGGGLRDGLLRSVLRLIFGGPRRIRNI
jgi:hypothetical protein